MEILEASALCCRLGIKLIKPENKVKYARNRPEAPPQIVRVINAVESIERKRIAAGTTLALDKLRREGILNDIEFSAVTLAVFDVINNMHSKET